MTPRPTRRPVTITDGHGLGAGTNGRHSTCPVQGFAARSNAPLPCTVPVRGRGHRHRRSGRSPSSCTGHALGRIETIHSNRPTARPWLTACCSNCVGECSAAAPGRLGTSRPALSPVGRPASDRCIAPRPRGRPRRVAPSANSTASRRRSRRRRTSADADGHHHDPGHDGQGPQAHLLEDPLEREADHIAEEGVARPPRSPPDGVVEQEHPVAEAAHAGQTRDQGPGEGHEPTEEHRRAP